MFFRLIGENMAALASDWLSYILLLFKQRKGIQQDLKRSKTWKSSTKVFFFGGGEEVGFLYYL